MLKWNGVKAFSLASTLSSLILTSDTEALMKVSTDWFNEPDDDIKILDPSMFGADVDIMDVYRTAYYIGALSTILKSPEKINYFVGNLEELGIIDRATLRSKDKLIVWFARCLNIPALLPTLSIFGVGCNNRFMQGFAKIAEESYIKANCEETAYALSDWRNATEHSIPISEVTATDEQLLNSDLKNCILIPSSLRENAAALRELAADVGCACPVTKTGKISSSMQRGLIHAYKNSSALNAIRAAYALLHERKAVSCTMLNNVSHSYEAKLSKAEHEAKDLSERNRILTDRLTNSAHELAEARRYMPAAHEARAARKELYEVQQKNELLKKRIAELTAENKRLQSAPMKQSVTVPTEDDKADETKLTDAELAELLAECNVVVVGGHDALQHRLKSILPSWKYVADSETATCDLKAINADKCIVLNAHMGHKLYFKVESAFSGENIIRCPYKNVSRILNYVVERM